MKHAFNLFLILSLFGCGVMNESRHQDLSRLEKPPGYDHIKPDERSIDAKQTSDSDTSSNQGLFSDVYRVEDTDTELRIKRNIDDAWMLVGKAILLNKLSIKGKNRKEGQYRIAYKTGGLLDGFGLFGTSNASTYLLKLAERNKETTVAVSKIEDEDDDDPSSLKDGAPAYSYDSSTKLTDLIFKTLQSDVSF